MLAELRADLNRSKKKIEDLQSQNDQLVKATHKSEEKDAKVFFNIRLNYLTSLEPILTSDRCLF